MAAAKHKIQCVNRFIELANTMAKEGKSREMVSSGLMTAGAVYATYVVTGNDGALRESGVDKVTNLFKTMPPNSARETDQPRHERTAP